jgi:hypothetical protein
MSVKKASKPEFTVQARAVIIFDVTVQDGTLSEAIELGKNWKRSDLFKQLDDAVAVVDDSYAVVGGWTTNAWNSEQ